MVKWSIGQGNGTGAGEQGRPSDPPMSFRQKNLRNLRNLRMSGVGGRYTTTQVMVFPTPVTAWILDMTSLPIAPGSLAST